MEFFLAVSVLAFFMCGILRPHCAASTVEKDVSSNSTSTHTNDVGAGQKTLIVTSILNEPYLMLKQGSDGTGNKRYEGYMADLLVILGRMANFSYEIRLVPDKKFGVPDGDTGRWSGMIGQLIQHGADLAVAPITVTPERKKVVDFTSPFSKTGRGILLKKPSKINGTRPRSPISSAHDLSQQKEIEYGMLANGSTYRFFKNSVEEPYRTMYRAMMDRPNVFVSSFQEGVSRVQRSAGTYAFISEPATLEYISHRKPCDTIVVGQEFDSEYAFATPTGSSLAAGLSAAINELKDNGVLESLYQKWWLGTGNQCPEEATQTP